MSKEKLDKLREQMDIINSFGDLNYILPPEVVDALDAIEVLLWSDD